MSEDKKDFVVKDRRIFSQDGDEKKEADAEKEEKIQMDSRSEALTNP